MHYLRGKLAISSLLAQGDSPWSLALPAAVGLVVILLLAWFFLRRKKPQKPGPEPLPRVDVNQLGQHGPRSEPPVLECQGVPVRLAAVIVAAVGRQGPPPSQTILREVLEEIVPGLGAVLEQDRPQVVTWPAQLSPRGFAQAVFAHTPLPGEGGKGTIWCIAAGRCEHEGRHYAAALVLAAASPNSMTHFVLEQPHQWQSLLRVRQS